MAAGWTLCDSGPRSRQLCAPGAVPTRRGSGKSAAVRIQGVAERPAACRAVSVRLPWSRGAAVRGVGSDDVDCRVGKAAARLVERGVERRRGEGREADEQAACRRLPGQVRHRHVPVRWCIRNEAIECSQTTAFKCQRLMKQGKNAGKRDAHPGGPVVELVESS